MIFILLCRMARSFGFNNLYFAGEITLNLVRGFFIRYPMDAFGEEPWRWNPQNSEQGSSYAAGSEGAGVQDFGGFEAAGSWGIAISPPKGPPTKVGR
jgi:hypothetical protein